jgi:hypothetical protein
LLLAGISGIPIRSAIASLYPERLQMMVRNDVPKLLKSEADAQSERRQAEKSLRHSEERAVRQRKAIADLAAGQKSVAR